MYFDRSLFLVILLLFQVQLSTDVNSQEKLILDMVQKKPGHQCDKTCNSNNSTGRRGSGSIFQRYQSYFL